MGTFELIIVGNFNDDEGLAHGPYSNTVGRS